MAFNRAYVTSLSKTIQGIYHDDPAEMLPNLCDRVRTFLPYRYSLTSLSSNIGNRYDSFCYKSSDMSPEDINDYIEHYEAMDFCVWHNAQPVRAVYRNIDLITPQGLESSTLYQKWMEPLDIYYTLFANCATNDINYAVLSFMRSKADGCFTNDEVFSLSIINDHLALRMADLYPNGMSRASFNRRLSRFASAYQLTAREEEIVELLRDGVPRIEIAEALSISPHTLKKHVANIYKKLDVGTIAQLFSVVDRYEA